MTSTTSRPLVRPCPVCGHRVGRDLHVQRYAMAEELHLPDVLAEVVCARCGMVFADLEIDQKAIDESYERHSKYADPAAVEQPPPAAADYDPRRGNPDPEWDIERMEGTATYLARHIPDRTARILDAGCANGTLLGWLRTHGFTELWGLEPSPVAVQTARAVHGVRAVTGSFAAPPDGLGVFSVVTLSHTLEHIGDVKAAVGSLRALLADGGLVYIEVPDASRYADHIVAPFQDFNVEHINHFSPGTLTRLMGTQGFELVDLGRKVIRPSARHTYPAAYGLWRKLPEQPTTETEIGNVDSGDADLVDAIERYVTDSDALLRAIDADLTTRLSGLGPVIVWGTGQLALRLLCDTVLASAPIAALIDGSPQKQGLHVLGHVIKSPEAARSLPDAPIVITTMLHDDAIERDVRQRLGLSNPIIRLHRSHR